MPTTTNYPSLNVSYSPLIEAGSKHSLEPLLEVCLRQTNSQGAYLYRLHGEEEVLQLAAWKGSPVSDIDRYNAQLPPQAARWHRENLDAAWIAEAAWSDWRLERFPEFLRNRFEAAALIPLVEGGRVFGLLHVCRVGAIGYQAREAAFLQSLGLPLGSMLAQSAALQELAKKLADRKVLDRAKGILQASFQWTEEEAYLFLRRTSRQRRTPMGEVAREVVAESARSVE